MFKIFKWSIYIIVMLMIIFMDKILSFNKNIFSAALFFLLFVQIWQTVYEVRNKNKTSAIISFIASIILLGFLIILLSE